MPINQATFGAGCFWGSEVFYRAVDGVVDARVGFATGSDGSTADARIEIVQVDYDPTVVDYETLVDLFWESHDPTSLDRQGDDVGELVRSAIFVHSAQQSDLAQASRAAFDRRSAKPATTQIIPYNGFELADESQQRYLEKNGGACSVGSSTSK